MCWTTVRRWFTALCLLWLTAASAEEWPAADWTRGEANPSPEALEAFEAFTFPPQDNTTRAGIRTNAIVVISDGKLIYERYMGETRPETPHLAWSVSKSVLATVLGVAFGEGRFKLDDPVSKHYPPFAKHPEVRIRHLLYWASGLAWNEGYEAGPVKSTVVAMLYTRGRGDMAAYTAGLPSAAAPGSRFLYSSGDSNVLSASLRSMVGEAYADYPWTALFEPLGITSAVWERDASGTFVSSSYAYMTARDLARVGLLMQRQGRWKQRQLLPPEWVAMNLTPFEHYQPDLEDPVPNPVPGGQWWLNSSVKGAARPWPSAPEDTFAGLGHWGQCLFVIPSEKLVIVRYADDRDGSFRYDEFLKLARAAFAGGKATP